MKLSEISVKKEPKVPVLSCFSCWHTVRFEVSVSWRWMRTEREIDLPLVEVGLSSAQYGALVLESACMFLCEHVCKCVCAHQSFCFMYFLCAYACPAVSLCVLRCARVSGFAGLSNPLRSKYCSAGKAEETGAEQRQRGLKTCTQTLLYSLLITEFCEGQLWGKGLSR